MFQQHCNVSNLSIYVSLFPLFLLHNPLPTVCMCLQYWGIQHRTSHAKQVNYIQNPLAYVFKPLPWVNLVLEKLLHPQDNICHYRHLSGSFHCYMQSSCPGGQIEKMAGWGSESDCWHRTATHLLYATLAFTQHLNLFQTNLCSSFCFPEFKCWCVHQKPQEVKQHDTTVVSLHPSPFCNGIKYTVELHYKVASLWGYMHAAD